MPEAKTEFQCAGDLSDRERYPEDELLAFGVGGAAVDLTKNEVRILRCLMQKDICTREELIEDLWTNGMYIDGNTLYVNIGRLREKLGQIGATDFIRTVRGVGYRL